MKLVSMFHATGKKTRILICCIVVVIIVVSAIVVFFVTQKQPSYITAKEGFEKAEPIAKKWNNASNLCIVYPRYISQDGKSEQWVYIFEAPFSKGIRGELTIKIYSNGNVNTEEYYGGNFIPGLNFVPNWTIDSDEAMEIAKKNKTIAEYLSKCPQAGIDMCLRPDETYSCVWWIKFDYPVPVGEGSYYAEIRIDGHTGKVLSAKATPVGPVYPTWWRYFECLVLPITIVIIIAVIVVLVIRKVFRWIIGGG